MSGIFFFFRIVADDSFPRPRYFETTNPPQKYVWQYATKNELKVWEALSFCEALLTMFYLKALSERRQESRPRENDPRQSEKESEDGDRAVSRLLPAARPLIG